MSDVARPQAAASRSGDVDVLDSWSDVSDAYTDHSLPTASPLPRGVAGQAKQTSSRDSMQNCARANNSSSGRSQMPLTHPEQHPMAFSDDPAVHEMQQLQFNERHFDATVPDDSNGLTVSQSQSQRLSRSLDFDYGQDLDDLDSGVSSESNHHSCDYVKKHARSSSSGGDRRMFGQNVFSNGGGSNSDIDDQDQSDKIKNKLMSAWNNMRHGWTVRVKTSFKYDHPIWLLGICYHPRKEEKDRTRHGLSEFDRFKQDFTSRLWFTYRQSFSPIEGTQITSDTGWGCMLRSGQMMISQALVLHLLGRDWMWYPEQQPLQQSLHLQIVRLFADSGEAPFSIHKLVKIGQEMGKKPGDWYGPASVAYSLRDAMDQASENPLLEQITLYVAQDCTVYIQDVIDLCTTVSSSSRRNSVQSNTSTSPDIAVDALESLPELDYWKPVIILIPVRLGGETLNDIYVPCLKTLLSSDMCLGIIGGKPKHSLYYIGYQDEKLIYLDPHFCQDYVDLPVSDNPSLLQSFHCMSPRKMSFSKMDPSCSVGFYCKNRHEFDTFITESKKIVAPPNEKELYPMYVFAEGRGIDVTYEGDTENERYLRVLHLDKMGRLKQPARDSDDFVFL